MFCILSCTMEETRWEVECLLCYDVHKGKASVSYSFIIGSCVYFNGTHNKALNNNLVFMQEPESIVIICKNGTQAQQKHYNCRYVFLVKYESLRFIFQHYF